jgi:hypothetical protein
MISTAHKPVALTFPLPISEVPDNPPKKGTKRKADAHMDLFGNVAIRASAKKSKAQRKKATTTRKSKVKRAPKKEVPAINNIFMATKNGHEILPNGSTPRRGCCLTTGEMQAQDGG